jgi:hypothetical protein
MEESIPQGLKPFCDGALPKAKALGYLIVAGSGENYFVPGRGELLCAG